ncbi:Cytochrome p450 [Thalictrum thalictroides]|uniref:Cytochrome p450 n=1 Tax=Thalictrum thalictroides TaxID=46969 RepID=A0A7J6WVL2_THATH|nr:Cytochrome p450 [Thalictrum thalictroides]
MEILISPLLCHSDPQFWGEDVHLFNPDRFVEGVANAAKTTNVYLPFGIGSRMCVGMNFATIEAKLALSMILRRYSFTLSPSYVHSPIQRITTRPQHGVQIIFHAL